MAPPVTAVDEAFDLPLAENGRICWALPNARSWRQQSLAFRIHVTAHSLKLPRQTSVLQRMLTEMSPSCIHSHGHKAAIDAPVAP